MARTNKNINDLNTALVLNPNLAHAHWLLAEIYLATGQADKANGRGRRSLRHSIRRTRPTSCARRKCAMRSGQYDDATLGVRAVLDDETTPPIVKAQALHEMGKLAALGRRRDCRQGDRL